MAENVLKVSVLGAKDLHNTELFTKQDPYVIFYYNGKEVHRTPVDNDGGKNPSWNDDFVLNVTPGDYELEAYLWNWNILKHAEIGSTVVNFRPVLVSGREDYAADVFRHDKKEGSLRMIFTWGPE
eukprot:TRINITY_DN35576_c0_g1_i1.p1 TRINITY_DN35576_c0_g1~~TRINITY_DN35576_c0_g1_i1.p1  ORF type:complete len:125 (+),score=19.16 TRINITY_DN35576_c0_g1_i1:204-578(+)